MSRRIDFSMFETARKENLSGGMITGPVREAMSEDFALSSVIKLLEPGTTIYWRSDGEWSMHQLLLALLNVTGAAVVHISSYAFSETAARVLSELKREGIIKQLHCMVDSRVDVRSAGSHQLLKAICDSYKLLDTHAKVTVIQNEVWSITVIGSANYTENKRYEAGIVTSYPAHAEMHAKWITKAIQDASE